MRRPHRPPSAPHFAGIPLCGGKDRPMVRYSVLKDSDQLFASKNRLVLPSEEELRLEMERDREEIEARGNLETESEQRMTDTNQRQLGDPLWPSLPPLTR